MEALADSRLFAVLIGIGVLILFILLLAEIRNRRNKPADPQNKIAGRKLLIDIIKSAFRLRK
jgi:hypothetical protein